MLCGAIAISLRLVANHGKQTHSSNINTTLYIPRITPSSIRVITWPASLKWNAWELWSPSTTKTWPHSRSRLTVWAERTLTAMDCQLNSWQERCEQHVGTTNTSLRTYQQNGFTWSLTLDSNLAIQSAQRKTLHYILQCCSLFSPAISEYIRRMNNVLLHGYTVHQWYQSFSSPTNALL